MGMVQACAKTCQCGVSVVATDLLGFGRALKPLSATYGYDGCVNREALHH